jgi:hypothetical protein
MLFLCRFQFFLFLAKDVEVKVEKGHVQSSILSFFALAAAQNSRKPIPLPIL